MSTRIGSRRTLTYCLNHLPSIPNNLIQKEDRICSICWEAYGSDASATSNVSYPGGIRSSASTSCVALGEACPFAQNENRSTSDIIVKTEICVEREVLAETSTHYGRCDPDDISASSQDDDMDPPNFTEDPVRLRCGHIFGRKCLCLWSVFLHHSITTAHYCFIGSLVGLDVVSRIHALFVATMSWIWEQSRNGDIAHSQVVGKVSKTSSFPDSYRKP